MSNPMKSSDPAYWMLHDGFESKPITYYKNCYICNDPEFAKMGLPLCYQCIVCKGHVAADDCVCVNGHEQPTCPEDELIILQKYEADII